MRYLNLASRTFFVLVIVALAPFSALSQTETGTSSAPIDMVPQNNNSKDEQLLNAIQNAQNTLAGLTPTYRIANTEVTNKKNRKAKIKTLFRELIVIAFDPQTGELKKTVFEEKVAVNSRNRPRNKPPQVIAEKDECSLLWRGGSRWGFNRDLQLNCQGKNLIVVGIKMPYLQGAAPQRVMIDAYTPYSPELHNRLFADMGKNYLEQIIAIAQTELGQANVRSRAFPEKLITEITQPSFIASLILNEHMDHGEFLQALRENNFGQLVEKLLIVIGLNREKAMRWSISQKGACCLTQFMPRTYKSVVKRYPEAGLDPSLTSGRQNHVNAVMASLVLFDSDIRYGWRSITKNTCLSSLAMLEKCLAASYNGGPGNLNKVVRRAGLNWDKSPKPRLKKETVVYLQKLALIKSYFEN